MTHRYVPSLAAPVLLALLTPHPHAAAQGIVQRHSRIPPQPSPPGMQLTSVVAELPASEHLSLTLSTPGDLPQPGTLHLTLRFTTPIPPSAALEIAANDAAAPVVVSLAEAEHDLADELTIHVTLQTADLPHEVSQLQIRATIPLPQPPAHVEHEPPLVLHRDPDGTEAVTQLPPQPAPSQRTAWQPLGRLAPVPLIRNLRCKRDTCQLQGDHLDRIASVATEAQPTRLSSPHTGNTVTVPNPGRNGLILHLKAFPDSQLIVRFRP